MVTEKGLYNFRGGPSWCNRLFKRNKLIMRAQTTVVQKLPNDWEEKKKNVFEICKKRGKKICTKAIEVGNMNEVPISFDMPTSRSADFVGVKYVPIVTTGNKKNIFTMALSCLS